METNALEERFRFICDLQSGRWSMSELCERFGISRPTGYKWLASRECGGSLEDRSRAPHRCPHRTPNGIEELLLAARRRYGWGAKKLRTVLCTRHPQLIWPARSTINDILDRHGLLRKKRRRKKWNHPGVAPLTTTGPNQIWPADFKGHFKLGGNGHYCYPLTITDHFSRSLLACRGLESTTMGDSWPVPCAVPRGRASRCDPNGQRVAVCIDRDSRTLLAEREVDAARDRAPENPPGESAGERNA